MKNIWKIIKISKPLHGLVIIISVLIFSGAAIDLVSPILSKSIVDQIVAKINGNGGNEQRLIFLIAVSFGANLVGIILSSVTDRLGDHFSGRLKKFLTEKFYFRVLSLPQEYFDNEISGKIVNQLNRAIFTIQNFINGSTNFILPMFLQSIFTVIILAIYNIPIAIFTFILFPTYMVISYFSAKKWGEYEVAKNKIEDVTRGRISEVLASIKLVKSFNNQKKEYGLVSENLSGVNRIYAEQSNMYHLFDFARNLSLHIILLAVNLIVFYDTFSGLMTIGTMVLILQLIAQARRPLFAMSYILSNVQSAEAGSKEYFEVLEISGKENFEEKPNMPKVKNPSIEFKNVTFSYEKSGVILKKVAFKISDLETVALVGPSGTGKTTIVNLICKFYKPTSGDIFLNGKSYKKLDHNFIRNNIALVFQESELFSTSVLENVVYGTRSSRKKAVEALKLANAWEFVNELPKGILSEVGERGIKLSGGQKQRIQIARAILKDSPILILDEATSSLDAKSEKEVQEALENLMRDKLVIVIAHRFSTIQNVDRVVVIDGGRIADIGNPKDLSARPGICRDLLHYQLEGNAKLLKKFEIY